MSVSGINNVAQTNNIQSTKTLEKKTEETSKTSNLTKTTVAIGAGVTALAAVGIYLATKGKGAKSTQETANVIKEMTVDAFKKAGNKFNKGKAVTSTGEAYTGSISHQTKDGKNIVREYENGVLKKSTKYDGENVLSQKEYNYDENGKISEILLPNKERTTMVHDNATGKISAVNRASEPGIINFYYSDEGALKSMIFHSDNKVADKFVGKFRGERSVQAPYKMFVEFDPATKKPLVGGSTDKTMIIDYDKNGKPSMIINRELKDLNNASIQDLKTDVGVWFGDRKYNLGAGDFYKTEMHKSTNDYIFSVYGDRYGSRQSQMEDIRMTLDKKTSNKKNDRYRLSLENQKSEIADYSHNGKNIAKYNVKTGDIEMLPDTGVAIDDVKSHINELYSHYNSTEQYYRNYYERYAQNTPNEQIATINLLGNS